MEKITQSLSFLKSETFPRGWCFFFIEPFLPSPPPRAQKKKKALNFYYPSWNSSIIRHMALKMYMLFCDSRDEAVYVAFVTSSKYTIHSFQYTLTDRNDSVTDSLSNSSSITFSSSGQHRTGGTSPSSSLYLSKSSSKNLPAPLMFKTPAMAAWNPI